MYDEHELLRGHIHARFKRWAWMGPVGNGAAALVWTFAIAPAALSPPTRIIWTAIAAGLCLVAWVSFTLRRSLRWTDRAGIPWLTLGSLGSLGVLWGSTAWLADLASVDPTYTYGTLAVVLAIGCGSMISSSGVARLTGALLLPLWIGVVVAMLANGLYGMGIGLIILAAITTPVQLDSAAGIRELILLQMKTEEAAGRDPLTGLLNRRGLVAQIEGWTDDKQVGVVYLDLDLFKQVNDCFGHDIGDEVLVEIGRRLATYAVGGATVARVGGDEFVLISPNLALRGASADEHVAEIVDVVAAEIGLPTASLHISVSAGVAHGRADRVFSTLIGQADAAMLAAKRGKRMRFTRSSLVHDLTADPDPLDVR